MQFHPSYHLPGASPLPLDMGIIFLVGSSISPVDSCSAVSFGVLTGEDECRNFYLTILCHSDLLLHLPGVTGKFGHGVQNEAV